MNGDTLIKTIEYLLQKEQSRLLAEAKRKISKVREFEINDEVREIEALVELARDGWTG